MSNLTLKRNIAKIWPARARNRKIILLYHSVGNTPWGMSEYAFSEQMHWLVEHCRVLSLTDLIHSSPDDTIQVAITFDDGYQSLYDHVAPLLTQVKINAMVYINTGWMGESINDRKQSVAELGHYPDESFLTWPEVKELYHAGWEIGSHGVNHYDFTLTADLVRQQELTQSKQDIEQMLGSSCQHFAYPWGRHSVAARQAVQMAGYQFATSARHAKMDVNSDRMILPRMNIQNNYSFADFKSIVTGKWDYLNVIHKIRGM